MILPVYTLTVEGFVIVCADTGRGPSITNCVQEVIIDLANNTRVRFDDRCRVVYRDTLGGWNGIAHCDRKFIGFVPLKTKDRRRALALAKARIDCNGRDWPRG